MLTVQDLACLRAGRFVFRRVGFTVARGGFLLVTGPNGSGKSSLLRVLAGLLPPAAGSLFWEQNPSDPQDPAARARLRYIGHQDALKPELSVQEMLDYWAALRGIPAPENALAAFGLENMADRPIRRLSAGQKRRLSLTRLALDDAPLWLLDEPTTALDAAGQERLMAQIEAKRRRGGIVIAASHDPLSVAGMQVLSMAGGGK